MTDTNPGRAHLIAGGFPPGSYAGHDHDYARLRLLGLLAERDIPTSVANDFADIEKWLPLSRLLITYVAGPYPDAAQTRAIRDWLPAGGALAPAARAHPAAPSLHPGGGPGVSVYPRGGGGGGAAFLAPAHAHPPAPRAAPPPAPADTTPPIFHGAWENPAFTTLLRNAIAWGVAA